MIQSHGSPIRVTRIKVAPNMAVPTSMKHLVHSLKDRINFWMMYVNLDSFTCLLWRDTDMKSSNIFLKLRIGAMYCDENLRLWALRGCHGNPKNMVPKYKNGKKALFSPTSLLKTLLELNSFLVL